jgi:hypothetical protein
MSSTISWAMMLSVIYRKWFLTPLFLSSWRLNQAEQPNV